MGKYLIRSSESKYKKFSSQLLPLSKILFGKKEEEEEEVREEEEEEEKKEKEKEEKIYDISFNKDRRLRTCNSSSGEGGRWNCTTDRENKFENSCAGAEGGGGGGRIRRRRKIVESTSYLRNFQYLKNFLILILIAMTFCGISYASPTPSLDNYNQEEEEDALSSRIGNKYILNNNVNDNVNDNQESSESPVDYYNRRDDDNFQEYYYSNNYEDFLNDDDLTHPDIHRSQNSDNTDLDSTELDKIRETIMLDLGLKKIPDPSKANVSQTEYEKAHREYLKIVELSKGRDQRTRRKFHVFYPADPVFIDYNSSSRIIDFEDDISRIKKTDHSILYFPFEIPDGKVHAIDHASLRLLIGHDEVKSSKEDGEEYVEVSIYQRSKTSPKCLISNQRVSISRFSPRWVDFDSTEAVSSWVHDGEENLGFQIEIKRDGVPVRWNNDFHVHSALNVFTITENGLGLSRNRRATPDQLMSLHRGRRTECRGQNKKCCRHQMTVIFKDLKGFEFIIQPKDFDAGYCKGRCPPRYNPAHHHALLQSLIWKEDRKKAPRPCCAPSKLTELEILYFDEDDATKLKISNWKNMKVLECACS